MKPGNGAAFVITLLVLAFLVAPAMCIPTTLTGGGWA